MLISDGRSILRLVPELFRSVLFSFDTLGHCLGYCYHGKIFNEYMHWVTLWNVFPFDDVPAQDSSTLHTTDIDRLKHQLIASKSNTGVDTR